MLLATLGKNKDYLELDKPDGKTRDFSFLDMAEIAQKYGVTLKGYHDEEKFIGHTMKLPAIILLDDKGLHYRNHAVMLYKVTEVKAYFLDPKEGDIEMDLDEFGDYYTGDILEVDKNEIVKYKNKKGDFLKRGNWVTLVFSSVLSVSLLIVGSFFIKNDNYILLPFIFIILFSIAELFEKWYVVHMMRTFDKEYYEDYVSHGKRGKRKETITTYNEFKKLYFNRPRSVIASLLLLVTIAFLLSINSLWNAAALLLIIVIAIVIMKSKKVEKREKELEEDEFYANIESEDEAEYAFNMHTVSDNYLSLAFDISIKECLVRFIILALSFILMLLNKEMSSNFVIFHFFLLTIFYEYTKKVISSEKDLVAYKKAKYRFEEIITLSRNEKTVL